MVSPRKVNNNSEKPLDEVALKKLNNDIQPYLRDKNLQPLKTLISKYESFSNEEIENILFTNITMFKAQTQHKIRDFVRRRLRSVRSNNEENIIYQSDDSNLVSPFSRDSFTSRSDINLTPDTLSNIKLEFMNLWKYPILQKELCQLLWDKGDLKMLSSKSVEIDFDILKSTTLLALQEFINRKKSCLEIYSSSENVVILHDILLNESLDNEKSYTIYKIMKKRESVAVNDNGTFILDANCVASMKPETIIDLIKYLRPNLKAQGGLKNSIKRPIANNYENSNNHSIKTLNQIKSGTIKIAQPNTSRFTTEELLYLSGKLKELAKTERISDVVRLVRESETIDQNSGQISLNVKKMKDVTIGKLLEFININKI